MVPSMRTKRGRKEESDERLSLRVWVSHLSLPSHQFSSCIPISFPFSHILQFSFHCLFSCKRTSFLTVRFLEIFLLFFFHMIFIPNFLNMFDGTEKLVWVWILCSTLLLSRYYSQYLFLRYWKFLNFCAPLTGG